jgi:hypothetical protein
VTDDLRRKRQQLLSFLLRHSRIYSGGGHWTLAHPPWLANQSVSGGAILPTCECKNNYLMLFFQVAKFGQGCGGDPSFDGAVVSLWSFQNAKDSRRPEQPGVRPKPSRTNLRDLEAVAAVTRSVGFSVPTITLADWKRRPIFENGDQLARVVRQQVLHHHKGEVGPSRNGFEQCLQRDNAARRRFDANEGMIRSRARTLYRFDHGALPFPGEPAYFVIQRHSPGGPGIGRRIARRARFREPACDPPRRSAHGRSTAFSTRSRLAGGG